MKVMSEVEVTARKEVELETYIMNIQIEGRIFTELVYNHIIPAAIEYQNMLIENVKGLKDVYGAAHKKLAGGPLNIIERMAEHLAELKKKTDAMVDARRKANVMTDSNKKAYAYCEDVRPYFEEIRYHCDRLERLVGDPLWPLTKYRELLFTK